MVDFDKLNAMIDEVHSVITDIETETKDTETKVYNIRKDRYDRAIKDLQKYCDILSKARGNFQITGAIEIKIEEQKNSGKFKFTRLNEYNDIYGYYGLKVSDGKTTFYTIIDSQRKKKSFENINHSHPSVIWFEDLIKEWDNIKGVVEEGVVNGVNDILKQQSEIAHKKYENAKSKLDRES
jgi:hypothetical protein